MIESSKTSSQQKVKDSSQYPSNITGFIKIPFHDRRYPLDTIGYIQSSGLLITDNIVLTCAHNLDNPQRNLLVKLKSFSFLLGYNDFKGEQFNLWEVWGLGRQNKGRKNTLLYQKNDFTFIQLTQRKQGFKEPRLIEFEILNDLYSKENSRLVVYIFGYPIKQNKSYSKQEGEIQIGYQFKLTGKLTNISQQLIQYQIKGSYGLSGAPIFIKVDDQFILIGIHKGMNNEKKCAFGVPIWIISPYMPKK